MATVIIPLFTDLHGVIRVRGTRVTHSSKVPIVFITSVEGGTRSFSKTEVFVVFNRLPHLTRKGAPSLE
jgi:hypothetical protein